MTSTTYSDLWQRAVDEALACAHRPDALPPLDPPASPADGARIQCELLMVAEAFGLPEPALEPIRYHEILL